MTRPSSDAGPIKVRILPDPERGPVTANGPLRSVQEAELAMTAERLDELWTPANLERFARGYWRYLNRISLGLLRIAYSGASRSVVLVWRRLRPSALPRAAVRHGPRVRPGHLADRARRPGFPQWPGPRIPALRRATPGAGPDGEGRIRVRAVVANFYPFLRGSGRVARLGSFVYSQTQLRIHVLVTRGYLRSLERGELPPLRPERAAVYRETAP